MTALRQLGAVLFDMDGVLVDSEPLWYDVELEIMAGFGATWTHADQRGCVGGQLRHTAEVMLARARESGAAAPAPTPAAVSAVEQALVDGMADRLARGAPLQPGAAPLLAELAAAQVPTALVTSSYRRLADLVLAQLNARPAAGPGGPRVAVPVPISVSVAGDEVRHRKPHPEPYLTAAARLSVDPRDCVVLEDSLPGLASAAAAGCVSVGVPDAVPLPLAPGRVIVDSLADIDLAWLRALAQRLPAAG